MIKIIHFVFIFFFLFFFILLLYHNKYSYIDDRISESCDSYILNKPSLYSTLSNKGFSDSYIRKNFFTSLQGVFDPYYDGNSIIVDVGSNKGDVSSLFHNIIPQIKIISIEPLIINYNYQLETFKNEKNIIIYNYGISDRNYTTKIYVGNKIGYMYKKGEEKNSNKIEQVANFITLDYFMNNICII